MIKIIIFEETDSPSVVREAIKGADLAIFVTSLDVNDTHVETGRVQKLNADLVLRDDAIRAITDAIEMHLGF